MLAGVNDSPEHARELAALLDPKLFKVNLIPYNPTGMYDGSSRDAIAAFKHVLDRARLPVDGAPHARPRHRCGLRPARRDPIGTTPRPTPKEAFRTRCLAATGNGADSEWVEAAHITWRPLGRLLVEQGLLSGDDLERALAEQQTTGQRLGETIVKLGFVSGPELANALAAQYGIELTTEKGFGTGLRSEIQRRHETDRKRVVQLVSPADASAEADSELEPESGAEIFEFVTTPEPVPAPGEAALLAQLEEQWAKLAAAEAALAERERELAELGESRQRELAELIESRDRALAESAEREQELKERAESREREFRELAANREREPAERAERERELTERVNTASEPSPS